MIQASSRRYPKSFVSPSLIGWPGLAWRVLPRRGSSRQQQPQHATTDTAPEQTYITIGVALRAAAEVVDACSGVAAVVVAVVDETSHTEARLATPS